MVTRVYGRAGQYNLEFAQTSGGLWTATVPFVESCEYVIDLYAEDEAGNVSYYATYLLTFDASKMQIYLQPMQYNCVLLSQTHEGKWIS